MSIRAIVFDLDNCLAAADEAGEALFAPAFDAMRAANHGRLSEQALRAAFADCWRHALDFVAKKHRFSEEMLAAGWAAFRARCPCRGCWSPRAFGACRKARSPRSASRRSKKDIFADILSRRGWAPGEVLVVGDNADSEIAAGNALGMPTVQVLRPGVPPAAQATWRINTLDELSRLV